MNFCVVILILKMEENMQHFCHILLYYFKKGKNAAKMQKKDCMEKCMEKVLWLIERVKSGLQSFVLEISHWVILYSRGQLKLIAMFYHVGDSQHTQNIQINKVIGENEKCVFYFMEKTIWTFWPTQYMYQELFFWNISLYSSRICSYLSHLKFKVTNI